eukprot:2432800-Amphidinium_carterae.1
MEPTSCDKHALQGNLLRFRTNVPKSVTNSAKLSRPQSPRQCCQTHSRSCPGAPHIMTDCAIFHS